MTPHVLTRSGMLVPLNQPTKDHIRLGDIAHALARIPRFNGHTVEPWSVADHSRLVARLLPDDAPPTLRLAALLHDAHEAYLGDITSPVAEALRRGADAGPLEGLKVLFDTAIAAALAFSPELFHDPRIRHADRLALAIERHALMPAHPTPWPGLLDPPDPLPLLLHPLNRAEAFLDAVVDAFRARHGMLPEQEQAA
jgi:hypothetical protein